MESATSQKSNKAMYIVLGAAVLIILGIGGMMFVKSSQPSQPTNSQKKLETPEAIPTVDSSVKVDVKGVNGLKELMISVSSPPAGTESIDYEISYQTKDQGSQGLIGKIDVEENKSTYEEKVTVGTCSSGTCVYHKVDGPIHVTLQFGGSYGQQMYEKEFNLE